MTTHSHATSTALTTLDSAFDGSAGDEAIKPILNDHPRLQWFNGLSTTSMEMAVGWHIEADVNPLLDEVAASEGLKRYIVQHKTPAQNGEAKQLPYWALSWGQKPISLFVVSLGLQSKRQMNKSEDRVGIAYGWEMVRDSQGTVVYKPNSVEPKKQCKLQFRAFVHELVTAGFDEWLQVGIAGYLPPVGGGDAAVVRGVRADRGTWHETPELASLDASPARMTSTGTVKANKARIGE
jgi:hypothetical protein